MAHNHHPGPLPPHEGLSKPNIPRMYNRFAKRDPALYPLAAIMATTLSIAGYFLVVRKPRQVETTGPLSAVQARNALLHDKSKGEISLEEYRAGTTSGIPSNVRAPNTMQTTEVPLPEGAAATCIVDDLAPAMWCTRWYLPLLFLPFPRASPYFVLLYLTSVTIHVKPCLYCVFLLLALFTSSCYWEPIPTSLLLARNLYITNTSDPFNIQNKIDVSPLIQAVADYNTTLANGTSYHVPANTTNFTLSDAQKGYIPLTRMHERCWCDFASSIFFSEAKALKAGRLMFSKASAILNRSLGFFDPYDQKGWESASLVRHSRVLAPSPPETLSNSTTISSNTTGGSSLNSTTPIEIEANTTDPNSAKAFTRLGSHWRSARVRAAAHAGNLLDRLLSFGASGRVPGCSGNNETEGSILATISGSLTPQEGNSGGDTSPTSGPPVPENVFEPPIPTWPVPFLRLWFSIWRSLVHFFGQKYDLTPYGLPVIVDFAWGRS